jgi:hypothetical protein
VNERLAEHGHDTRIDHRSLEAQGEVREPTYHKGPAVTAIERRGESTRVGERIRADLGERLQLAAELGVLQRESNDLARSIIDTTTELKAAIASRDAEHASTARVSSPPPPAMPDIRRDAQTEWLALIAEQGRAERQTQARERSPTLDLSSTIAAAAASRTTPAATPTREHAQATWLVYRDVHASGREQDREAATPATDAVSTTHPDDDLTT